VAAATVFAVAAPFGDRADDVPAASPTSEGSAEEGAASTRAAAPEPGTPVEPTDVRVRSVTAASADEFWVLGDAACPGGECPVIGHTDDAAGSPLTFTTAPGRPGSEVTMRMATNGEDGWVVSDGRLYATHDSTRSWKQVESGVGAVEDVVASTATVWLTGRTDPSGAPAVATGPSDADTFTATLVPSALGEPTADSEAVLEEGEQGRRFGFLSAGESPAFVAYEEAGPSWQAYETPGCRSARSLSGTSSALWALCVRTDDAVPMVSTDGGETWEVVEVDMDLGAKPQVAAIDPGTAFVSTGVELYVLNGDRLDRADPPSEGAGSKTYEYMGFGDDRTGFLIDSDGVLSRSDNGGASWEPVELP
jgi:hypothetical protein